MLKRVKIESPDFESPFEIEFSKVTLITGEYHASRKLFSCLVELIDHLSESSSSYWGRMGVEAQIFDWTYSLSGEHLLENLQVAEGITYRRRGDLVIFPTGREMRLASHAPSMISVLGGFSDYPEAAKIREFASRAVVVNLGDACPDDVDSALSEESPWSSPTGWEIASSAKKSTSLCISSTFETSRSSPPRPPSLCCRRPMPALW